jgi:Zn-dependent protease/CBS domain-containing protein
MFSNAIKLFDLFGFQIRVDPSWVIIAALIVWSLSTGYFPGAVPGLHPGDALALAIVAMLGLFACLILHELAHSLVARSFGLGVGGITLFLFGGVAELEQEPESAESEFWIAVAGPAMSFALAALAWVVTGAAEAAGASRGLVALFGYLAAINLILALFNLLPAFPLDGGRVLRAALWKLKGDLLAATRIASLSGSIFGYVLVAFGFFALFSGQNIVGGLWPILVGLFLAFAARGTYQQMLMRQSVRGRFVGDLMTRDAHTIGPDRTIRDLVEQVMLNRGVAFVPVVENGAALGYVDTGMVRDIEPDNWDTIRVEDVFVPRSADMVSTPRESLESLLGRIMSSGRRKYIVEDGRHFAGVITLSDLVAHINVLQELSARGSPRRSHVGFDARRGS